jgi:hypothetical protein
MKTPHTHAKKEALFSYRVDLRIGPTNWSDGGIESGAADTPGSREDRSSFTFRRNIVVIESGEMFAASTSNGYRDMTFEDNVYYDLANESSSSSLSSSAAAVAVGFPCDPDAPNRSWLSAPSCLLVSSATVLQLVSLSQV